MSLPSSRSLLQQQNDLSKHLRYPVNVIDFNSNIYANLQDLGLNSSFQNTNGSFKELYESYNTPTIHRSGSNRPVSANLEVNHCNISINGNFNQFSISGRFNKFSESHTNPDSRNYLTNSEPEDMLKLNRQLIDQRLNNQTINQSMSNQSINQQTTLNQFKYQQTEFSPVVTGSYSMLPPGDDQELSLADTKHAERLLVHQENADHSLADKTPTLVRTEDEVLVVNNEAQTFTTYNHLGVI